MNKRYIVKSELKRKLIMMCFQGSTNVMLKLPLKRFWLHKRCISVNFSHVSLLVYAEFVYVQTYLILNIDICSMLVRIGWVVMKPEWSYILWNEQHALRTVLNLVPGTLEIAFKGFEIPKFSGGARQSPSPPQKKGTNCPLLIQSLTLFKPAGYFNHYWNPWVGGLVNYASAFSQ